MKRYTYDNNGIYTGITTDNPPPFRSTDIKPDTIPNYYPVFNELESKWDYITIVKDLTNDQIASNLLTGLELYYDSIAQLDNWDTRFTCIARAGYPNQWQSKAIAFGIWMDSCNEYAYIVKDDCINGKRSIPTLEELIAELPTFSW